MTITQGIDRDRLGVLSGALLLALAIARFLETPMLPLSASVFGSPLGINLSSTTLLFLIMAGLAITATGSLVRSHPMVRKGELEGNVVHGIVPTLLVLGLAGWLAAAGEVGLWILGLLISAVLIPLALAAEYASVDPDQRRRPAVQWGETVLIYIVALMLFALIYDQRARALLSGTAVLAVTTLLVVRVFWFSVDRPATAWLYALTVGILTGLATWAINYWPITTLQGGLLLFLLFYVIVGLIQQYLHGRFGRRVVLEYGGVAAIGSLFVILLL